MWRDKNKLINTTGSLLINIVITRWIFVFLFFFYFQIVAMSANELIKSECWMVSIIVIKMID